MSLPALIHSINKKNPRYRGLNFPVSDLFQDRG